MRDEIHQQIVVVAATILGGLSSLAAAVPFGGPDDLWENSRFVMTCVAGSFAGAILLLGLPHPKMTPRKAACEVFFAFLVGLIFSPALIDHFNVTRTTTWVLPSSVLVALVGVGTLRVAIPLFRVHIVDKILSVIGYTPKYTDEQGNQKGV